MCQAYTSCSSCCFQLMSGLCVTSSGLGSTPSQGDMLLLNNLRSFLSHFQCSTMFVIITAPTYLCVKLFNHFCFLMHMFLSSPYQNIRSKNQKYSFFVIGQTFISIYQVGSGMDVTLEVAVMVLVYFLHLICNTFKGQRALCPKDTTPKPFLDKAVIICLSQNQRNAC